MSNEMTSTSKNNIDVDDGVDVTDFKNVTGYPMSLKSAIMSRKWTPNRDADFAKYQKEHQLQLHSILLCDLGKIKDVFRRQGDSVLESSLFSTATVLKPGVTYAMGHSSHKAKIIIDQEREKRFNCWNRLSSLKKQTKKKDKVEDIKKLHKSKFKNVKTMQPKSQKNEGKQKDKVKTAVPISQENESMHKDVKAVMSKSNENKDQCKDVELVIPKSLEHKDDVKTAIPTSYEDKDKPKDVETVIPKFHENEDNLKDAETVIPKSLENKDKPKDVETAVPKSLEKEDKLKDVKTVIPKSNDNKDKPIDFETMIPKSHEKEDKVKDVKTMIAKSLENKKHKDVKTATSKSLENKKPKIKDGETVIPKSLENKKKSKIKDSETVIHKSLEKKKKPNIKDGETVIPKSLENKKKPKTKDCKTVISKSLENKKKPKTKDCKTVIPKSFENKKKPKTKDGKTVIPKSLENKDKPKDKDVKTAIAISHENEDKCNDVKTGFLRIPKTFRNIPKNEPLFADDEQQATESDMLRELINILSKDQLVDIPEIRDSDMKLEPYVVSKVAWWFLKEELYPPPIEIVHPEIHDDSSDNSNPFVDKDEDNSEFNGGISDPENTTRPPEDTNQIMDPDVLDEYCGRAGLHNCLIGNVKKWKPEDEKYVKFWKLRSSDNYCRESLQAKCRLCEEKVFGARNLALHIRSLKHKRNFQQMSLDLITCNESSEELVPEKIFVARLRDYSRAEAIEYVHPKDIMSSTALAVTNEIPDFDIKPDKRLLTLQVSLQISGAWTMDLQKNWDEANKAEARFIGEYEFYRDKYISVPKTHPKYEESWKNFWYLQAEKLESCGVDPESFDFLTPWNKLWPAIFHPDLKKEWENRITSMRKYYGVDYDTLKNKADEAIAKTSSPTESETSQNEGSYCQPPTYIDPVTTGYRNRNRKRKRNFSRHGPRSSSSYSPRRNGQESFGQASHHQNTKYARVDKFKGKGRNVFIPENKYDRQRDYYYDSYERR